MYIYHKQCEIMQKIQRNSSNGQLHWFPIDFLWKWSIMDQNYANANAFFSVAKFLRGIHSGWAKQNSENSGLFRNFLNAFWLSYPHPHSIGPFLCRKFSLIILCILLFARVHFRISCIYEKDLQKKKVNTGETRIFRQHKFIAFRYLNVYYKKAKPKLKSL